MIIILFEIIKIEVSSNSFKLFELFNLFKEPQKYDNYGITLESLDNFIKFDFKTEFLFEFILTDFMANSYQHHFLTFYSEKFRLLFINIENYNKEKIILIEFLNKKFRNKYHFKTFIPSRSHIWKFLRDVNIIDLELVANKEIINYSEIENKSLLNKINQNLENYAIYSSYISFKIDDSTVPLILYGSRFDLPDYFDPKKLNSLINKMSSMF